MFKHTSLESIGKLLVSIPEGFHEFHIIQTHTSVWME
jgi:hypothetical protein